MGVAECNGHGMPCPCARGGEGWRAGCNEARPVVGSQHAVTVRHPISRLNQRRARHGHGMPWPYSGRTRSMHGTTPRLRGRVAQGSAGLAGNRTAACLRLAEPSSAGPCQAEQRSEPEGPRSRVPGGIQGSANPFHTPSASAQACRCKARCVANSGSIGKQRNAVRCMLERSPCGAIRPVRTLRCDFSTGPDMPSKPRLDCGPA